MTETTVAEAPAETVPTPAWTYDWPIAEETLAADPAWRAYFADHDALAALEAAPDVMVLSGLRSEFDRLVESYAESLDGPVHAQVASWWQEKCEIVHASDRPGLGTPVPHFRPADGEEARQQHQMASVTDLRRWAPDKSLDDDPETDKAATRFMAAFDADPDGDTDRAPLPAEVHHETGEHL